jgi:hypothetical protein
VRIAPAGAGRLVVRRQHHLRLRAQLGTDTIAGINFVAAATKAETAYFGPGRQNFPNMLSEDLATNIAGTRAFLRACFERRPAEDAFEIMLAFNMVVPPRVRAAVFEHPRNTGDALAQIKCPVLVTHGTKDKVLLVALGRFTAALSPAQSSPSMTASDTGRSGRMPRASTRSWLSSCAAST